MKNIARSFMALCILLLTANYCAADQHSPGSTFRFGVILPFSGEAASAGESIKNGLLMGLESLPKEQRGKIEVLFEDDQMLARNAVAAFNRLQSTGGVDAIINASSSTGKALAPLAEQQKVTFISISSDPAVSAGRDYVFSLWVTPAEEAKVMVPAALKRGYKKIARISSIQDGIYACNRAFDKVNQGRLEMLLDEEYPLEVKDFRPFLTKARALPDLDAIVVALLPGHCATFARQARQMGLTQPFLGYEMFEDSAEVKASDGALIGQLYVNADNPTDAFLRNYQKRFPGASSWMAANGNDAALLVATAVQRNLRGRDFANFLATLKDFSGALGTFSAAGDHSFTLPAAVKVVKADGFERLAD